jgi:hypothetical protein
MDPAATRLKPRVPFDPVHFFPGTTLALTIGLSFATSVLMKLSALLILAFALSACSQRQQDQSRAEARQTAEELKQDSKKAFHEAEAETKKAGRELDADLIKAREKARRAINERSQPDKDHQ